MKKVRHRFQFKIRSILVLVTLSCFAVWAWQVFSQKTKMVLVAKEDLSFKTVITKDNVEWEAWPVDLAPDEAFSAWQIPEGKILWARCGKGRMIFKDSLFDPGDVPTIFKIPTGHQVVDVKLLFDFDLVGGVLPGDLVDVVARIGEDGMPSVNSPVLISNARVFNIGNPQANRIGVVGVVMSESDAESIKELNCANKLWLNLKFELTNGLLD